MNYIGMVGRRRKEKRNVLTFNEEIVKVIYEAGNIPLGILVDFDNDSKIEFKTIKPLLEKCDGVILQGGSEYSDVDILITKYLHKKDIPVLGICLGMQTMAMTFGGIMSTIGYSHNRELPYVHDIDVVEDSKLYEIIEKKNIPVNSRHSDYIVSTDLDISAYSNVPEAVEDKSKTFFLGVQWHPESVMDENSKRLFNSFFEAIKLKKV